MRLMAAAMLCVLTSPAIAAETRTVKFDDPGYNDIRESGCDGEISDSCNLLDSTPVEAATLQEAWSAYVQQFSRNPDADALDAAVVAGALQEAMTLQKKAGGQIYAGIVGVGPDGPLASQSRLPYAPLIQVADKKGKVIKGGQLAVVPTR